MQLAILRYSMLCKTRKLLKAPRRTGVGSLIIYDSKSETQAKREGILSTDKGLHDLTLIMFSRLSLLEINYSLLSLGVNYLSNLRTLSIPRDSLMTSLVTGSIWGTKPPYLPSQIVLIYLREILVTSMRISSRHVRYIRLPSFRGKKLSIQSRLLEVLTTANSRTLNNVNQLGIRLSDHSTRGIPAVRTCKNCIIRPYSHSLMVLRDRDIDKRKRYREPVLLNHFSTVFGRKNRAILLGTRERGDRHEGRLITVSSLIRPASLFKESLVNDAS